MVMKLSGFTIARNAVKFNYPILESIRSILSICDEFVVNVGDSQDNTLALIESIRDSKIKIIQNRWDMSQGKEVLSQQTNLALKACQGEWAFYLQSDEVVHEDDLPRIEKALRLAQGDDSLDALRFAWLHFYGSYFRYRIDAGWYQKQDRIIRNNGQVMSVGDAYAFARQDGKPLTRRNTGAYIYHYGWVHSGAVMTQRRVNAETIGFTSLEQAERQQEYSYGDLNRFPIYFGTHPAVMKERVKQHVLSQVDFNNVRRVYWWNPLRVFKVRYKTSKRVKEKIQ